MPSRRLTLPWPMGGVVKRLAYSTQPPNTCPDALNVRPDCTLASRERGGSRPGLVKYSATQLGSGNPVRLIKELFYTASSAYAYRLLASANGLLYKFDEGALTFSTITTQTPTLASDRPLMAADLLNKLYITGDNSASRTLCVYNPSTDALAVHTATSGTLPTKCYIVATYRDRLVMAGDRDNPHVVYASRQGNAADWDDTDTDAQAAWRLTTSDAGRIGQPVTALVPHGDDCCLVGCYSQLWVIRSDPTVGGSIDNLSRTIGIMDYLSWCHDPEGNLWFLSLDGLYFMSAGCGNRPISVSRERLPEELLSLDPSTSTVTLAYDEFARGIHIVTKGAVNGAWYADIQLTSTGDQIGPVASFWPQTYQTTQYAVIQYHRAIGARTKSLALWGGSDGYIRRHDQAESQDDGSNAISSYVTHLVPLAEPGHEGVVAKLEVVSATSSGDIDVDFQPGRNAEAAAAAAVQGTFENNTAGWNPVHYPRVRGGAVAIKVKNGESNARWAIEELNIDIEAAGARR